MSSIKEAAAAAREAIKGGTIPGKLAEPAIADAAGKPQTGAGAHEGERPAQAAPARTDEVPVTFLEDEEVADALEQLERKPGEEGAEPPEEEEEEEAEPAPGAEPAEEGEEGAAPAEEGAEAAEPAVLVLPPMREGAQPIEVDIDDPETADRLRAIIKAGLRRTELNHVMADVERRAEHLAQFEDALRLDPVSLIAERARPEVQADLAEYLYTLPHVQQRLQERFGEGDAEAIRVRGLELDRDRANRRRDVDTELDRRAQYRERGRAVRDAIQRMIPEDMDAENALLLAKDLERDVTEHILANPRAANLRPTDLPAILERRLALHGITADEAAERLQDTGVAPLPVGARAAARGNGAPARGSPRQPARTGKEVVAQANARRRAGAVPGGGAGIPAAGVVLPRKQGVKARIQSIRELILGG